MYLFLHVPLLEVRVCVVGGWGVGEWGKGQGELVSHPLLPSVELSDGKVTLRHPSPG